MTGTHHLFTLTRLLLRIATLFSLFLIAVLCMGLGALVLAILGVFPVPIPADVLDGVLKGVTLNQILVAAVYGVMSGVICIALAAWMFLLTARIVDTASSGDPFVVENAARLNLIACLLLAIQLVGLIFDGVMSSLPDKINSHMSIGFDVSASGILAALLIFVLAQIFRRGSEMRAELEGTV